MSESVLYALNQPQAHARRFIDRVRVKGKMRPVSIYEIFDQDEASLRQHKVNSRPDFEHAVAYYHTMHCEKARNILARLCNECAQDIPARVYLDRCNEYLETGRHHGTGETPGNIEWLLVYQTGQTDIDEQHYEWFLRLRSLLQHLETGVQEGVGELFDYLREYIEWHFAEEDALMERYGYPLFRQHKLEHAQYAHALGQFKLEWTQGDQDPLLVVYRADLFMVDWFVNHVTGTDQHLGRFIAQRQANLQE